MNVPAPPPEGAEPWRVAADDARAYCCSILGAVGFSTEDATTIADALVETSLRGVDTHGFVAILPAVVEEVVAGSVDPRARPTLVREHGATAVVDGCHASGFVASRVALARAVELAEAHGCSAVSVRNLGYTGALWWSVAPAAARGLVAATMFACDALVAPYGGKEPLHGTNPIAVAVPAHPVPIVVDMRLNQLRTADSVASARSGAPLPPDALLTTDGRVSRDPADLQTGVLLPLAGARGYALALVVDVMAAALAGGPIGREIPHLASGAPAGYSSFFLVLDPAAFAGAEVFAAAVASLVAQAESTAPIHPERPVRLPGARGASERAERLRVGIPVDRYAWTVHERALRSLGLETRALRGVGVE
jgi:LDH2 family malate/lactate/ureidoglycolate dehydrogenase